jgi:hypothetical protein
LTKTTPCKVECRVRRDAITQRFKELQAIERGEAPPEPELSDDAVITAAEAAAQGADDPELVLTVFGNRLKRKRSSCSRSWIELRGTKVVGRQLAKFKTNRGTHLTLDASVAP